MGLQATKGKLEQARQKVEVTRNAAPPVPSEPEPELLSTIRAGYIQRMDNAISSIMAADTEIAKAIAEQDDESGAWMTWYDKSEAFEQEYAAAAERSSAHATRLKELAEIEKQLGEVRAETDRIRAEIIALGEADAACDAARAQITKLRNDRTQLLAQMCATLSARSGDLIRAAISRSANVGGVIETLKECLKGSGMRTGKIDALAETITGASNRDHWRVK
jgi:hypothetical protein